MILSATVWRDMAEYARYEDDPSMLAVIKLTFAAAEYQAICRFYKAGKRQNGLSGQYWRFRKIAAWVEGKVPMGTMFWQFGPGIIWFDGYVKIA